MVFAPRRERGGDRDDHLLRGDATAFGEDLYAFAALSDSPYGRVQGHAAAQFGRDIRERVGKREAEADRVLDAYASPGGVRGLLVARGGVIAAIGALLYEPALSGVTVSLSAASGGAKLRVHSAFDPNLQSSASVSRAQFTPALDKVMPSGSMLLLDVTGLERVAPHVLAVAGFTGLFLAIAVARLVSSEARRRRGFA